MRTERCFVFSPQEIEAIVKEYDENAEADYSGGRIIARVVGIAGRVIDELEIEEILSKMRPELSIGDKAEAIYEQNYQAFREDSCVIVIDNVRE